MYKAQYFCPIITCFDKDRNIDEAAQRSVYEYVMAGGIRGFIVMGSIGEFFALSMTQRKQMADIAVDVCKGRAKTIIGCGSTRIDDTVELANYALDKGADAVIIVPPYYFALTEPELERWYDLCADRIHGDIFLYNFPGATGSEISPALLVRLLKKQKISQA
ncbi:MAG: dihydrodipicolinate synthase family protein [Firmicutes bacterium]|nr:dihydrodipicolinate synthase family protein [Bacillota bacterium]